MAESHHVFISLKSPKQCTQKRERQPKSDFFHTRLLHFFLTVALCCVHALHNKNMFVVCWNVYFSIVAHLLSNPSSCLPNMYIAARQRFENDTVSYDWYIGTSTV